MAFVNQRNISDMGLREKGGITYKYYTAAKPTFGFGHGLSYTTFTFEHVHNTSDLSGATRKHVVSASALAADDRRFYANRRASDTAATAASSVYAVKVTNTGAVASPVVVLGFVNATHPDAPPNAELFDFARVAMLMPGASQTVTLAMNPSVLAVVDKRGVSSIVPSTYDVLFGVDGAAEGMVASTQLVVTGDRPVVLFSMPNARQQHKDTMAQTYGAHAELHDDFNMFS